MPLNMNTVGTGNGTVAESNTGNLFEFITNYTEKLTSNVQKINSGTVTLLSKPDNYPYSGDGNESYSFGSVFYNGFYYAVNQVYSNSVSDKFLYKYRFVKNSSGKYDINIVKIPEMKGTVGVCLIQDKLLVATSPQRDYHGKQTCFYLFDGTSWTKISDTIFSMAGLTSISNNNTDAVPWILQPVLNDDLTFTGDIFGYFECEGSSTNNYFRGMMYFHYDIRTGSITCTKYQWNNQYVSSDDSLIGQQMDYLPMMTGKIGENPIIFFIGIDRFIKIECQASSNRIRIALFQWNWGTSKPNNSYYNGSKDNLTVLFEKLIPLPSSIKPTTNTKILVEPLSYPKYDAFSITLSHYVEGSRTKSYIDDIWILRIDSLSEFSIVDLDVPFYNTVVFDQYKSSYGSTPCINKCTIQLYDPQPYMIVLVGKPPYSVFAVMDITVDGDIDATGSSYSYSGDLLAGDTIYSDDGIISVSHGDVIDTFENINKYTVTKTGEYTIVTNTSSPYVRPAFVIKTNKGSLLHLDINRESETSVNGYFLKNMKLNGITVSKTGFQIVPDVIENGRVSVIL